MRLAPFLLGAVLAITALSGCASKGGSRAFPQPYLLEGDEIPAGLVLGDVPEGFPVSGNPARVDKAAISAYLSSYASEFQEFAPEEAWVEFLENPGEAEDSAEGGVLLAPAFWNDPGHLDQIVSALKGDESVCSDGATLKFLRDDQVLVLVAGDQPYFGQVEDALKAQAPGLSDICG